MATHERIYFQVCPAGFTYSSVTRSWYYVSTQRINQSDASAACQSMWDSAHLVAIQSQEEFDVVKNLVISTGTFLLIYMLHKVLIVAYTWDNVNIITL